MLNICKVKNASRKLEHSENIFHEVLNYVIIGEFDFEIVNKEGENYGLEYINNDDFLRSCKTFPEELRNTKQAFFPEYFDYNENDDKSLYLEIFENYSGVFLKDINEYTIAIAKVLLEFTNKKVYIIDKRFLWFIRFSENLKVLSSENDIKNEKVMIVTQEFVLNALSGNYDLVDSIEIFHNVFHHQYYKSLINIKIKGVIVTIPKTEGIGSILNYCSRMKFICQHYGLEIYVKPNCTRYKDEMLNKYFNLPIKKLNLHNAKDDEIKSKYGLMNNLFKDDEGNYYIDVFPTLVFTDEYYKTQDSFLENPNNTLTLDVLNDNFLRELEEYRKAVFCDKKVLGVLVRGSDYIVYNMPGQPLPLEEFIPIIRNVKEEGGYDAIFLATEDKDYYNELVRVFSKDLIAISQNRISKNELKDCIFISELEKAKSTPENYEKVLEDDMVNYFYALYLLSKCEGFLATPTCSGVFMAKSFNKGKYKFFKVVEKKSE